MWRVTASRCGMPRLDATQREWRGLQAECRISVDPDLWLANFLPELTRHAPGPPAPAACTTEATAPRSSSRVLDAARVG